MFRGGSFYLVYATRNNVDGTEQYFVRWRRGTTLTAYANLTQCLLRNSFRINRNHYQFVPWGGIFQGMSVNYAYFKNLKQFREFYASYIVLDEEVESIPKGFAEALRHYIANCNEKGNATIVEEINNALNLHDMIDLTRPTTVSLGDYEAQLNQYNPSSYYVNYIIKTALSHERIKIGYTSSKSGTSRFHAYATCLPDAVVVVLILVPLDPNVQRLDSRLLNDLAHLRVMNLGRQTEWLEYDDEVIDTYLAYFEQEEEPFHNMLRDKIAAGFQ